MGFKAVIDTEVNPPAVSIALTCALCGDAVTKNGSAFVVREDEEARVFFFGEGCRDKGKTLFEIVRCAVMELTMPQAFALILGNMDIDLAEIADMEAQLEDAEPVKAERKHRGSHRRGSDANRL